MADATIEDLSRTGCRLNSGVAIEIGTVVSIAIEGLDAQAARIVRSDEGYQGCQFLLPLSDQQVELARLAVVIANPTFPEMRGRIRADAAAVYQGEVATLRLSSWQRFLAVLR